ncbi:sensor histidine kinase [Stackebrandtia nassauensis]|uniref:histidine kinase n=1 Tax=Stackebrandtia nassauensis (strain DSM 44728 / CIP 108903 / NRRL B-16338 / NBRC 102104 / LLR-40K-21) TaxID=446470 RepID=D3PX53_STANL|nr:sensor histidine kinase [Stackebrandtia nassauensis]ADD45277.1 histidine kinase [Stackebrandtia nassauensis DSM 44728]
MSHTSIPISQTTGARIGRRFKQLGLVFPLLGLSIAGLVMFVLFVVGMPLVFLTVGIPLVVGAVGATRGLCNAERFIYRVGFGVEIDRPYRPWPKGNVAKVLLELAKDASTWRNFGWQAVNFTLGFIVFVTYIALLGGALMALIQPFLWLGLPDVFDTYYGFISYDSFALAMTYGVILGGMNFVAWWVGGDAMLNGYARLAGVMMRANKSQKLQRRVVELTESRADTVDSSAAELRRIERDLHDGAQARLVALGMSLGMAEEILTSDPQAAAKLLAEARENSGAALSEIRDLVRGIHPPVLADRGLGGAVEALALAHPLPVTVETNLPGRPPEPVESAAYFAVAEALTNVAKYAQATEVFVRIGYFGTRLGITVRDNGRGGATVTPGGGLDGVTRRLAAFDGVVTIRSEPGGPTIVAYEIPCELTVRPSLTMDE